MRVLIVGPSTERSKGGMATVIENQLADPILNKSNQLTYLISHVEGSVAEKAWYSAKSLLHILFNQGKYDIIHLHTAADASFYRKSILMSAGKLFKKKIIIHLHGADFDSFYLKKKPFLKKYIQNTLEKANKILVLSDYWKRFFDKEFANVNVEVLENGIDLSVFESCINQSSEFNNFLFLGRLGERKGTYDLLKAVDIIVNNMGKHDLKFYFAGDGDIDRVTDIINKTNLAANVEVLGWLNNNAKKDILNKADVVVLPSYDEGLPMALIEAMACGKVIISTYAGGIPDLVKNDFNGYLFKAGDIDQLVKCILLVSENPDRMKVIRRNNIETIQNDFNQEKLSIKLNAIYASL